MPFTSTKDKRELMQRLEFQTEPMPEASGFGEVFAAGVGQVFDEELSISGMLNRDGWDKRRKQVEQLIDAGELDKDKYTRRTRRGTKFDYDAVAKDFPDVKSSFQLNEERNELLKERREYAQDVFERGSGMAQFLGSMTGYMLDPISIATMPIATATTTAKGLGAVGQVALKAGAVEMATETAIQGLVMEHKHDIDSPYTWKDALTNVATAATGAAALGGVTQGISEYIKSVRLKSKALPQTDKLKAADDALARVEDTLRDNPYRAKDMNTEQLVEADVKFLAEMEDGRKGYNNTLRRTDDYIAERIDRPGKATVAEREKTVLKTTGQLEDYSQDILRFKELQGTPPQKLYEAPQDFKGVKIDEQVKVRETGEVATVKVDAEKVWRQTVKRRNQADVLRACLDA